MAHMQKINKNGVYNMLAHDDRSQENIGNVDVDRTLSHLNYSFADESTSAWQKYTNIMNRMDVHCLNRKDVNTLVSWVITAPKGLSKEKERLFFENCHYFLTKRYGKNNQENDLYNDVNNIVSSVVHMDETTPHLHFKFVPLKEDKKHVGEYKVSAKEVVGKRDLDTFHRELDTFLEQMYGRGYFPSVMNGIVKEQGNESIKELKSKTLAKIEKLEKKSAELRIENRRLKSEIGDLSKEKEKMENNIAESEKRLNGLKNEFESLQNKVDIINKGIKTSYEVEDILEEIKPLAEVLKDEYAREFISKAENRNKTLRGNFESMEFILKKSTPTPKKSVPKYDVER